MLESRDGIQDSYNRAAQAVWYIGTGLGLLQSLQRVGRPFPERPAGRVEAIEAETSEIELNCLVCSHEKAEAINKALQDGRSLRELETEYNISRSTLSRHKNRCLGLSAARIAE
jgi:DNA invertase Pin-like site-specific DNA recombinase